MGQMALIAEQHYLTKRSMVQQPYATLEQAAAAASILMKT
jgi:hypothetical protein